MEQRDYLKKQIDQLEYNCPKLNNFYEKQTPILQNHYLLVNSHGRRNHFRYTYRTLI